MAGRRGPGGRQRLVEAAFRLFATRGFERTTSRDIAGAAGVALGLIHRHFGGLDGLVRATDRRALEWTKRRMGRALPLLGQVGVVAEPPGAEDELALAYVAAALLSGRKGAAGLYFATLEAVTQQCERLQRGRVLRDDLPAGALAQFLLVAELGGLAAYPQHRSARPGSRRPPFAHEAVMRLIGEALRATAADRLPGP